MQEGIYLAAELCLSKAKTHSRGVNPARGGGSTTLPFTFVKMLIERQEIQQINSFWDVLAPSRLGTYLH